MLKKDMEITLKEYQEILIEIGRWANPIQYKLYDQNREKLLFHLEGIKKIIHEKFYKLDK